MAINVLVIGKSGAGKSRSLKNFKKGEIGIIQGVNKPLPFKSENKAWFSTDYNKIKESIVKLPHPNACIDDAGYLITTEFMNNISTAGYDKYNKMGFNFFDLIKFTQDAIPNDKIVFYTMHEEEDSLTGTVKPKTIGKLLDEKVCIEGMFTIVLRAVCENGNHVFYCNNNGIAKSPEGMFESDSFENDLKYVEEKIRDFYDMPVKTSKAKEETN